MDWPAIVLSAELALATLLVLLPLAVGVARWLAVTSVRGKAWIEGLLALPLVLPPTVPGYYLLVAMGSQSTFGRWFEALLGHTLAFSFTGLVVASVIFNIPFAVQPIQRAFEGIAPDIREAAQCCGLTFCQAFPKVELPLAWPGILSGNKNTLNMLAGQYFDFIRNNEVPLYVGEFGVNWRGGGFGELKWTKDMLSIMEEHDRHWTYWTYKTVANSTFPDGIYRYVENPPWVNRKGPVTGWESFYSLWPKEKDNIIASWRTEHFKLNSELCSLLKKHF